MKNTIDASPKQSDVTPMNAIRTPTMKTFVFLRRQDGPFNIVEIKASAPAEAIRMLVAAHGHGPWSILNVIA